MSDKIFSLLGPENIGCGRKLKPDQLVKLTDIRRSYEKTWRPFDAHLDHVLVDDRKYAYASSIDRIVCFTKDIDLYVSVIFGHIENDIICGHALPSTFSFSFSFTEDDIESSYHEAVVSKNF